MTAKLSLLNELIVQDLLLAKAGALKVELPDSELDTAFADLARLRVGALEVMPNPFALRERQRVAGLALKYRMPTVFAQRESVEAGG